MNIKLLEDNSTLFDRGLNSIFFFLAKSPQRRETKTKIGLLKGLPRWLSW